MVIMLWFACSYYQPYTLLIIALSLASFSRDGDCARYILSLFNIPWVNGVGVGVCR